MPNKTGKKHLYLPLVDNPLDEDRWGEQLNENFQMLDKNEELEHSIIALKDRLLILGV